MLSFLVTTVVYAAVLSVMPWVKHKGFGSCLAVAAIMAGLRLVLVVVALPFVVGLGLFTAIPVLGWLMGPPLLVLLCLAVNTLALYAADQMIEDFEIATMGDTALTAIATGVLSGIVMKIFGA